jgi:hypothetical protein
MGIIKQLHVAGGANIEQGLTVVGGFDADVITQNGQPVGSQISLASDPRTGGGQAANIGTIGYWSGGPFAYVKFGPNATDWILFPGATTRQTLVSNQTDVTFSGLNGNLDGDYELSMHVLTPTSGTVILSVQPNSTTTNQSGLDIQATGAAATGNNLPTWQLGGVVNGASGTPFMRFRCRVTCLTGFNRDIHFDGQGNPGIGNITAFTGGAEWTDQVTNITSLTIHSSLASAQLTGSSYVIRPLGVHTAC